MYNGYMKFHFTLSVHQDIYNKGDVFIRVLEQLAQDRMLSDQADWARARDVLEQHEGVARDINLAPDIPLN